MAFLTSKARHRGRDAGNLRALVGASAIGAEGVTSWKQIADCWRQGGARIRIVIDPSSCAALAITPARCSRPS
jgi:histidyl-tRNA synthetase